MRDRVKDQEVFGKGGAACALCRKKGPDPERRQSWGRAGAKEELAGQPGTGTAAATQSLQIQSFGFAASWGTGCDFYRCAVKILHTGVHFPTEWYGL